MAIHDRDYMRRSPATVLPFKRNRRFHWDWPKILAIAVATFGVASAALYFYRDARDVVDDFGPAEGSLRVNLNTATQEELESVPGFGPTRAAQVIAGRPYSSIADLEKLDGIGPAQVKSLSPFIKVEGDTESR